MSKVLIKGSAPKKILVKAPTMTTGGKGSGIGVDYDVSGKPVFVLGQGGGAGRGKTGAEKVLSRLGGAASALGGFMGAGGAQHRSLGSALSGGIGAGYQGAQLGGQLGRFLSGRKGRAVANLKEQQAQDKADIAAHKKLGIPLPKRLGGEGPVKVQSSGPKADSSSTQVKVKTPETDKDVTAATTNPMGITPKEAKAAMKVIDASEKIEPGQRPPGTSIAVGDPTRSVEEQGGWGSVGVDWGNTPIKTANGSAVPNTTLAGVAPQVAPKNPPPGTVGSGNESADPQGTQVNAAVGLDTDNEQVTPNAMEPPKANEQSKLGSSEEQQAAIANQGKREEQRRLDEEEQQKREAGFKQTTLKMVKVE